MSLLTALSRWWHNQCQDCGEETMEATLIAPNLCLTEHAYVWCDRCEPDKYGLKYLVEGEDNEDQAH